MHIPPDYVYVGKRQFQYEKALLATALLALLALSLAGAWAWGRQHRAQSPWHLVPGNALAVLELPQIGAFKEQLAQTPAGQELMAWPAIKHAYQQLLLLDSLAEATPELAALLYEKPLLASIHRKSKYDVDWLLFSQIGHKKAKGAWASALLQAIAQSNDWNYRQYRYRGHLIEEVSRKDGHAAFACLHYKDYLLASPSPMLVEEAIRWYDGAVKAAPLPEPPDELPANAFRLVLNGREMAQALHSLLGKSPFASTKGYWMATISPTEKGLQWEGKTLLPEGEEPWQRLTNTLPNSAEPAPVHCLEGQLALWAHWRLEEPSQALEWLDGTPSDWSELSDAVGHDVYWALVQTDDRPSYAKAMVLAMPNQEEFDDYWEELFEKKASSNINLLPAGTWGALMLEGKQVYAQKRKGYLVVSESQQAFSNLQISSGCTYPSVFSLQMGATPALAWPLLLEQSSFQWRKKLGEVQAQAMRMSQIRVALQDHKLEGELAFHTREGMMSKPHGWAANLPAEAAQSPLLVKNHYTQAWEVLLVDRWNNLKLIDAQGKVLWSRAIGLLGSPIWLVDHYKNGKQQFLFYAGGRLHLFDRNGNEAGGYPHALGFRAKQVALLPMAEQGYAIGMDDGQGNLYIYTYYGKPMFAWNPRPSSHPASLPLNSVIAGEQRLIASLSTHGAVQVLEENGKMLEGFPVTFQDLSFSDAVAIQGNRKENSFLYIMADRGTIIQLDMEGALRNKWQLPHPNPVGFAGFLKPQGKYVNSWIVGHLHERKGRFFSIDGHELFAINLPLEASDWNVQVLKTGEAAWVVALHHAPSKKAWLYYGNGQPLSEPLDADLPPALQLLPEAKKILLARTVGKQCLLEQIDALGAYATAQELQ